MALNAMAFAMVGLIYGLSHWILYTSGIRANPAWWSKKTRPDELVPEQAIGAMGELAAAIGLLFLAFWSIVTDPFLGPWSQIVTITGGVFGFLFLGTYISATRGYDWRPIGDAALFGAGLMLLVVVPLAATVEVQFPWHFTLGLYIFAILAASWGLVIHGKASAKILQANLIASLLVAVYFLVFASGIMGWPAELNNVQTALTADGWFVLWGLIGIVTTLCMVITYLKGPEKQIIW